MNTEKSQLTNPSSKSVGDDSNALRGYFVQIPAPPSNSAVDLRLLFKKIYQYRYTLAIAFLLPVIVAIIAISILDRGYRSEVLLGDATGEAQQNILSLPSQLSGLASLAGISTSGASSKDRAIAILLSRSFTENFINEHRLMPILFADKWDSEANRWKAKADEDIPTISDAVTKFREDVISINEHEGGELVTLRIEWTDREIAATWANLLVARLNDFIRARDISESERSIEFLNRELQKNSTVEIRQGIFRLLEQQIEKIMIANVRREYVFDVLDPAVVSDADDYVSPKIIPMVIAAVILGLFFAVVLAFCRSAWDFYRSGDGAT